MSIGFGGILHYDHFRDDRGKLLLMIPINGGIRPKMAVCSGNCPRCCNSGSTSGSDDGHGSGITRRSSEFSRLVAAS